MTSLPKYIQEDLKRVISTLVKKQKEKVGPVVVIKRTDVEEIGRIPTAFCKKFSIPCCTDPYDKDYYKKWYKLVNAINNVTKTLGYALFIDKNGNLVFDVKPQENREENDLTYFVVNAAVLDKNLFEADRALEEVTDKNLLVRIAKRLLIKLSNIYDTINMFDDIQKIRENTNAILLDPVSQSAIQDMKAKGCDIKPHPICVLSKESQGMTKEEASKQCIDEGKIHWISLAKCPLEGEEK